MNNLDVAQAFYEIADLLEFKDGDAFKVRAYRKAAQAVELWPEEIGGVAGAGRLTAIPGIGKATAEKILELLTTGQIEYLEELRRAIPPGVRDLTRVSGLGARTAELLYARLGIDSLDRLELAARQGELRDLPGIGVRKEAAVLAALERLKARSERAPLGAVLPVAEALLHDLRRHPAVVQAEIAGSIRRQKETVGDIDLVVATANPTEIFAMLSALSIAGAVVAQTLGRLTLQTSLGRQVDIYAVAPSQFAATLLKLTGSAEHLALLGEMPDETETDIDTEEAIYRAKGLPFIPPELREGRGEVEAAGQGRLPHLITVSDLRGDLHTHTRASDGTATLQQMAEAARALGHRYLAICDHSQSLVVAGGLSPERLKTQTAEIRQLQRGMPDIRLLSGSEVDILKDGTLDFPDSVLAELDVVVASIHSHMRLDAQAQTERLIRAIMNPHVDIIGHPTGRLLTGRDPYPLDFERVLEACSRTGTALEISASPSRLDLDDTLARLARERGVKLVINTDAHSTHELGLLAYGVGQARRAWVEPGDVVNTMEPDDLQAWLAKEKR